MNENAVGEYRTFGKLSPPLRAEEDRLAVVEGLSDGTIDAIASDHAPEDQDASACRSPRRHSAASAWRRCCRSRSSSITTERCRAGRAASDHLQARRRFWD